MKTALFTVSFAGLWGQHRLSLEEAIEKTASLGFQGVEIMGKRPHLSPLDYSLADCDRLRARLEKRKLTLAAVAAYTNFTGGMAASEVPFVDMQVGYVEALAQRAARLGGDLVRIFTSYERTDTPFARQWQITVEAIRQCCDRAAAHGVTIGVQNHHDIGVHTKAMRELLAAVDRPNVIPMHDCWSPHLRGEDVAAGARAMAKRMRFTTVADYVTVPRARYRPDLVNYLPPDPSFALAVPMGDGELPYRAFFSALARGGFDGWVSYEMCSPIRGGGSLENLERYARQFLKYMQKWKTHGSRKKTRGRSRR